MENKHAENFPITERYLEAGRKILEANYCASMNVYIYEKVEDKVSHLRTQKKVIKFRNYTKIRWNDCP